VANVLTGLGNCYFLLEQEASLSAGKSGSGDSDVWRWRRTQMVKNATNCYDEAWQILQHDDDHLHGLILQRLGELHLKLGQYAKSLDYYELAFPIVHSTGQVELEAAIERGLDSIFDQTIGRKEHSEDFLPAAKLQARLRDTPIWPEKRHLRVSTDRHMLITADRAGTVSQWDLLSGARLNTSSFKGVKRLAISPDGQLVATWLEGTIEIWNLLEGALVSQFQTPYKVRRMFIRADNQVLATVNDFDFQKIEPGSSGYHPFVQFWHLEQKTMLDSIDLQSPDLFCSANPLFLADDWQAIALGLLYDSPYGWDRMRLYAYTLDQEPPLAKWTYNDYIVRYDNFDISAACFSKEGKLLALGVENLFRQGQVGYRGPPGYPIQLWRQTRFFPITPISIILFPLALLVVMFLSVATRDLSFLLDWRPFPRERSWVHSPGAFVRSVFVGRLGFGKGRWLKGHANRINWLQMTPDQQFLLSGSQDQTVRIWQMPKGRLLATLKGFGGSVTHGVLRPGGQLLATGNAAGRIAIWRIPDGELLFEIATEEGRGIDDLIASPDGQFLISSHDGGPIKVWRWSGQEAVQLQDSA
jgi:WD40 repeat protein